MKKDINYYMSLPYKIEIDFIPKEKGGGVQASIPELGRFAFLGYGRSIQEALADLEETKKENFEDLLTENIEISEPEKFKKEFRGEILVRVPKFLHKELYEAAQENGISLNQYMNYLLLSNFRIHQIGALITNCFEKFWENIWDFSTTIISIDQSTITPKLPRARKMVGA